MSGRKDGGPAFPVDSGPSTPLYGNSGMSLRDWFAGMAMQGLYANTYWNEEPTDSLATISYQAADAMLAERSKETGE